jgi:uncharacterized protein YndB with AHSA1/START domain
MAEPVTESITVAASAERVWQLVSDITRMPEWSPELRAAKWLSGSGGPAVGARFKGSNRNGIFRWSTTCRVTEAEPGRCFGYRVTSFGMPVADWRFDVASEPGGGCRLTQSTVDRRGLFLRATSAPATGVVDRAEHNRAGMRATLTAIKATAEKDQMTAGRSSDG